MRLGLEDTLLLILRRGKIKNPCGRHLNIKDSYGGRSKGHVERGTDGGTQGQQNGTQDHSAARPADTGIQTSAKIGSFSRIDRKMVRGGGNGAEGQKFGLRLP